MVQGHRCQDPPVAQERPELHLALKELVELKVEVVLVLVAHLVQVLVEEYLGLVGHQTVAAAPGCYLRLGCPEEAYTFFLFI